MNLLKTVILGSLLLASTAHADGFGFSVGPFSLQFNAGDPIYAQGYRTVLDDPICFAITHQNRLAMVVESSEKISDKELKIVTRKLVVEPYAFGITSEGQPLLHGNVVEEKLIKEVSIKYGEPKFDENNSISTEQKQKGYFSGWFKKTDKNQNVDLRQVSDLQVLDNTHFEAPKNYKGLKDDNVRIICQLPVAE